MWMIIAALAGISLAAAPSFAAAPIVTSDGEAPGITLQVQELKVSNATVMLKFTVVNNGSSAFNPDTLADKDVPKPDYHSISGIYLIDAANKKKYLWCTTPTTSASAAAEPLK